MLSDLYVISICDSNSSRNCSLYLIDLLVELLHTISNCQYQLTVLNRSIS